MKYGQTTLNKDTVGSIESVCINPLSPNSDQRQFSPINNIHRLSRDSVMRNKMITLIRENVLIFYQILSTHSLQKYIEISLENLYVDIGT